MNEKKRQSDPGKKGTVARLRAAWRYIQVKSGTFARWILMTGPVQATLLDLPYMVDSALRHTDFRRNCLWGPPNGNRGISDQRQRSQGGFLLCAVIVFMIYGATLDALCSVFVPPWHKISLVLSLCLPCWGNMGNIRHMLISS